MAEGGAAQMALSQAMKQKEALGEAEKESKERLEVRQKQMESINKVESDIDDLLAFAKKSMAKGKAENGAQK